MGVHLAYHTALHSSLVIPDHDFEIAWRLRIGVIPMDGLPTLCKCGAHMSEPLGHYDHALSCNLAKKTTMYFRHNLILVLRRLH